MGNDADTMTAQQYDRWTKKIRESRYGVTGLRWTVKAITALTFGSYALLLLWLLLEGRWQTLYESILVPGVSFVAVSVFRSICPARRPYEELAIQPILVKETKGKSFPSRHVFSIAMIAMTFLRVSLPLAVLFFVLTALLAALRVLGGVHYVRDVAAGAAMGVLCGLLGFFIL